MGAKFDKIKCGAMLRQSQARINIHRSKKLSGIAKKKDDICKHLESGNEVNAKIWCETLINEEALIPVYDVVSTMCDQVNGRLTQIEKFGAPKDMNQTFATIIHAAPKIDVKELMTVSKQLSAVLSQDFVRECQTNYDLLNPVVASNIDFKKPEDGEVILRMVNLAKERNIEYKPSHESCQALGAYCLRKGIPPPEGVGGPDGPIPQYVPQPAAVDFAALDQPPNPNGGVPMMPPPGQGMPPPGSGMGGAPGYNPGMVAPAYNPAMAPGMVPQMMQPQMPPPGMNQGMPQQMAPGMGMAPAMAPDMGQNMMAPQNQPQMPMAPQDQLQNVTPQQPQDPSVMGQPPSGAEEDFEERLRRLKDM